MKKAIFLLAMLLYSVASFGQINPSIIAKIKEDYRQNQSWRTGSYYAFEKITIGDGYSRTFLHNRILKELLAYREKIVLENNALVEQINRLNAEKQQEVAMAPSAQGPQPKLVSIYEQYESVKTALKVQDQEIAKLKAEYNRIPEAKKKAAGAWVVAIQFLYRGRFGGLHRGVAAFFYVEGKGIEENTINIQ